MKARTCFSLPDGEFPIRLDQTGRNTFTVTYGKQVKPNLTYSEAARELGECIMHERACAGKLDAGAITDEGRAMNLRETS